MTNFEAISAEIYPYNVDESLVFKACVDNSVEKDGEYSLSQKIGVAKAAIDVLRKLIVLVSESNGGYALSYKVEELKERIFSLASANGLPDIAKEFNPVPTVEFLDL